MRTSHASSFDGPQSPAGPGSRKDPGADAGRRPWRRLVPGRRRPAGDYRVYLRGGPELCGPRLSVPPAAGGFDVQVPTADGGLATFRISGDFELLDGRPRRVYEYYEDAE